MMRTRDDRVHRDLPVETKAAVLAYVEPALHGPLPEFGSPDWVDLPPEQQHQAVIRAALAWWSASVHGIGLPDDLVDRLVAERLNAASKDVAAGADWPRLVNQHRANRSMWRARNIGYEEAA